MLFIVHCKDSIGAREIRKQNYETHLKHLLIAENYGIKMVMAGPIVDDTNEELVLGSCLLVESESKRLVERFNQEDPYFKLRVWDEVTISHFKAKNF